jgi:hypothetical protein
MIRTIVLVLCLASAGGITAYTLYSRNDTREPVYTVPSRPEAVPRPLAGPEPRRIEPDDRAALARELQRELKRVGCYSGEVTGVWTASSRLAMKTFVEHVNAALPVDAPDPVLLSLVQGHRQRACGPGTTTASSATAAEPSVKPDGAQPDPKTAAAAAAAGAAGALAIGASNAATKQDGRALPPPNAGRPSTASAAAAIPATADPATASQSGPVPPAGVKEKAQRRAAQAPRPPKLVRDVMKALGIK